MKALMVALMMAHLLSLALGQAVIRWYRLYGVSGYEILLKEVQYDGGSYLYGLASLRQSEGEDGISLVRYDLNGTLVDARPYGLANGVQEDAFGLQLLPNGDSIVVGAITEPIWEVNAPRPERTVIVYYPNVGNPSLERRANGLPVAMIFGNNRLYIATTNQQRQGAYLTFDPATQTVQATLLTGSDGFLLDIGWASPSGVVLGGWNGTASGRDGFYWQNATFTYLNASFGYVARVIPLESGNLAYLWGSGTETETQMYGPDGMQAEEY